MNRAEITRILTMPWTQEAYHKELAQHYICQIEEEIGDVLHRCQQELRQVKKTWAVPQDVEYAEVLPQRRLWQIDLHDWVSFNKSREERKTPAGEALYKKVWEIVNKDLPEEEWQELQKWNVWEKFLTNIDHYFLDGNPEEEATYPFLHTMTLVLIYLFLGMCYPTTEMKALSNDAGAPATADETPSDTYTRLRNASGNRQNRQWVKDAFTIARENEWLEGDTPPFRWKEEQQALYYFIACAFSRQDVKLLTKEAQDFARIFGVNDDSLRVQSDRLHKEHPLAKVRRGEDTKAPEAIKRVVYALTR